ncbi:MAG: RNHCP domain-containing protein [Clostridia bacterium]|nr:RNHCP domain-containing protein [Clostridia bacterium]
MSRRKENTGFICENCHKVVQPLSNGSFRNHCPFCLFSKHLDIVPGDRESECHGLMKPIAKKIHTKKGIQIMHQCISCGHIMVNRMAEDEQGDDMTFILSLPIK